MLTNSLKQENEAAAKELKARGVKLLEVADQYGIVKFGWWKDGICIAPANKPQDALRIVSGN
jgi:hypothetical protein